MKKKSGLILSLGVSSIAIFWAVREVNIKEFMQALKLLNLYWLLVAAVIYLMSFFPRGVRWQLMLSKVKNVSFTDSFRIVVLGYASNNLLPFRLGEVVRAYIMGIKNDISRITCFGSIAAERIIDGIVIVSLLGLSMIYLAPDIQRAKALDHILILGGIVFLCAAALLVLVLIYTRGIVRIWKKCFGSIGLVYFDKIVDSIDFLNSKKLLLHILLLSYAVWVLEGAMLVMILAVMGYSNPVAMGYFCLGIINLGILLPSAPGYVGVFQASTVFAFMALGYSESEGLAYGILVHIPQFIPVTAIGTLIFIRFGISFEALYKTVLSVKEEKGIPDENLSREK